MATVKRKKRVKKFFLKAIVRRSPRFSKIKFAPFRLGSIDHSTISIPALSSSADGSFRSGAAS